MLGSIRIPAIEVNGHFVNTIRILQGKISYMELARATTGNDNLIGLQHENKCFVPLWAECFRRNFCLLNRMTINIDLNVRVALAVSVHWHPAVAMMNAAMRVRSSTRLHVPSRHDVYSKTELASSTPSTMFVD
jgi:hypothetical protein